MSPRKLITMTYEIQMRDVPELRVATEARDVDQAQLLDWLPGAMARVVQAPALTTETQTWVDRPPTPDPVFVVIYEGNPNEGPTRVEVCAPVAAGGDRTLPAHREAFVRVTKAQVTGGELGAVYEAIEKAAGDRGLTIVAAPREVYWTDFGGAADDAAVFDVAFPVAGSGA
jgi:hypothetical protein